MSDTIIRELTQKAGSSEATSTSLVAFCPRGRTQRSVGKITLQARMARLKRAIVEGAYHIDAQRIAGKLLKRG